MLLALNASPLSAQFVKKLSPQQVSVQHGGSIGYVSAAAGYTMFKNHKGILNAGYGFVPAQKGGTLHIATVKFLYYPFELPISNKATFYPLNPGLFIAYTAGRHLNVAWDNEQYPKGYYWWSPALRPHVCISNEVKFDARKVFKASAIKTFSVYSEFNTNELYLISYFQNTRGLPLTDIIMLGAGMRIGF